jgi:uncharacterized protein YkwD
VFTAVAGVMPQVAAPRPPRIVAAPQLAKQVAARVNLVRRWYGLPPLRTSPGLTGAARRHSRDMAAEGYFEHDSAGGTAFWRRIQRSYGAKGFARWEVGENIAWNRSRATAVDIVRQWMRSPPHRANVLSHAWRELGLGAFRTSRVGGAFGGRAVTIVTLDLGVRSR